MDSQDSTVVSRAPGLGARARLLLLAALALGLLLRGIEAHGKSLWLDELHTLDVASRATYAELNDFLKEDVHTPLFYLVVQSLYGQVEVHGLRWLAIVGSMLCVLPLLGLARSCGMSPMAQVAACGAFSALPYQVQWGAELRPYAWLEFAALTLAWAAFTPCPTRGSRIAHASVFAAAVAFGLYTHLFTAIAVLGIGTARLVFRVRRALSLPALLASGALGVALFVPWLATTHSWLFRDPTVLVRDEAGMRTVEHPQAGEVTGATQPVEASEEPTKSLLSSLPELFAEGVEWVRGGMSLRTLYKQLLQVPLKTLVPRIGSLNGYPALLAHYGFIGLLALLISLSVFAASKARNRSERVGRKTAFFQSPFAALIVSALVASVILSFVCVKLVNRIPLQYFTLSAWAWPLVFGAFVDAAAPRGRAFVAALFVASTAMAGFGQATGDPRENLRGGVEIALREARSRAAWLTAVLWQPDCYAHTTPFWVYAPEAEWIEPEDVPSAPEPGGDREVVILTLRAPDEGATHWNKWGPIIVDADKNPLRRRISVQHLDDSVSVYVYGPIDP